MRRFAILFAALSLVTTVGCGKKSGPVVVTPEMEAAQRRSEEEVREAESAMRKQQTPARTREQEVNDAESARQGGR